MFGDIVFEQQLVDDQAEPGLVDLIGSGWRYQDDVVFDKVVLSAHLNQGWERIVLGRHVVALHLGSGNVGELHRSSGLD